MRMNWIITVLILTITVGCQKEPEATYGSRPVSYWIMNLRSPSEDEQEEAVKALTAIGKPAVPLLVKVLKHDKDSEHRQMVALVLGEIGSDAKAATKDLLRLARDEKVDPGLRGACLQAFIRVEPDSQKVVATAKDMLEHGDLWGRRWAAHGVRWIGPRAKDLAPAMARALIEGEDTLSMIATDVLESVGPQAKVALPILLDGLTHRPGHVKVRVLTVLHAVGAEGDEALNTFLALLKDEDPEVLHGAVKNIAAMGPTAAKAVPALIEILEREKYYDIRLWAIRALGEIGPNAKSALPILRRAKDTLPLDRDMLYMKCAASGDFSRSYMASLQYVMRNQIDRAIEKIDQDSSGRYGSPSVEGTIVSLEYEGNNYLRILISTPQGDSVYVWCSGGQTKVYSGASVVPWTYLEKDSKIHVKGQWITQEGETLFYATRIDI